MARSAISSKQFQGTGISIEGLDELKANIDRKLDLMTGLQAKRVFMRAGLVIVRAVREYIHNITGKLSAGIFATYGKLDSPDVLIGVSIGATGKAPHGWVVEHGHHLVAWGHETGKEVAPHPYFSKGVIAAREEAAQIIVDGMKDLIENG
jgi:hypothetical protein